MEQSPLSNLIKPNALLFMSIPLPTELIRKIMPLENLACEFRRRLVYLFTGGPRLAGRLAQLGVANARSRPKLCR